ncbi:SapC family protein [Brucella intermedia]|uniref:SapC family protein n=1 Tax=Brucella intermedia TaxID=94625 RepID=UPI000468F588|nr:SapC family protein [Brucella intermedia]
MTNTMLLYKNVTALSRDLHRSLRLKPTDRFGHAAGTHWVPLSGVEFFRAALHYPIVFVQEKDKFAPVALLSLRPGHNDWLDTDGRWRQHSYIPAFIRRYPFVLADTGAKNGELTVCIDNTCDNWNENEGQQLFTQEGQNTPFLDEMMKFMDSFRLEMQRTADFVETVAGLGLLVKRTLTVRNAEGQAIQLKDIYMIDEQKLSALKAQNLHKLNQGGTLGWIFAHLMSLANLPPLLSAASDTCKPTEMNGSGKSAKSIQPA